ncbi:MAG: protease modulator HflC [Lentisphaeria bacterium]|nr:protease modulator HflC [Lentisphaeria bacterium]
MSTETEKKKSKFVVALIAIVSLIFIASLFFYTVEENQYAVVIRLGEPQIESDTSPGIHAKLPYPIDDVWYHDRRAMVFAGNSGELEEVLTKDKINVIVSVYITWRVDPNQVVTFMNRVKTTENAQEKLTDLIRSTKNNVIGRHSFSEFINANQDIINLQEIQDEIYREIAADAQELFGIEVRSAGIQHFGLPENTSQKVFERMRAERKREADTIRASGRAESSRIKAEADTKRAEIISTARAEATTIRAQADKLANQSYQEFAKDPELASFLFELEALEKMLNKDTYLILDTTTPPMNLFSEEYLKKMTAPAEEGK